MTIVLRPWTVEDVPFMLKVRNHPDLMKWFRQDEPLTADRQRSFILGDHSTYNGMIVELDGKKIGMCGVKNTQEFTIAILPKYQHKGIATRVMKLMIKDHPQTWSEVFVGNPALEWFISKLGFKVVGVKERAYYKKELGLVDVVEIRHE